MARRHHVRPQHATARRRRRHDRCTRTDAADRPRPDRHRHLRRPRHRHHTRLSFLTTSQRPLSERARKDNHDGHRRHRRFRQHRNRPHVQTAPLDRHRTALDDRRRPRLRRPQARSRTGPRSIRRRRRLAARPRRTPRHRVRSDLGLRARPQRASLPGSRDPSDRPDTCRTRPLRHPAGEPRRPPRRVERQHGHLRWPGHDPDGVRRVANRRRRLRRDRRHRRVEVRRAGHPSEHRRVHPHHIERRRSARRRDHGQGDHHPEPGRTAAADARHDLLLDPR